MIGPPSISTEEYYYGPSLAYGLTDHLRIGAWLTNQYPLTILKKTQHAFEWRAAVNYGTYSKRLGYSIGVTTFYGMPSRRWSYNMATQDFRGTTAAEIGIRYRWNEVHSVRVVAERNKIWDVSYYDCNGFEPGINTLVLCEYTRQLGGLMLNAVSRLGVKAIGGEYNFWRGAVTLSGSYPLIPSAKFRFFAGTMNGASPVQESFFIQGSVWPSSIPYWFLDPDMNISTLANLRVAGDANLRGYYETYRKGKHAFGWTSEIAIPSLRVVRIFADVGNVWNDRFGELVYDFGIGLDADILRIDFPLYISHPQPGENHIEARWLVEVKI